MARAINRLTNLGVKALKEPGLYADGAGLYLRIDQTLKRRWVLIYQWKGRRREMGLGSETAVTLPKAREKAKAARQQIEEGVDPIAARRVEAQVEETFGETAARVIEAKKPTWRNPISAKQWESSLKTHAPRIWAMPVSDVTDDDVLYALRPIWHPLAETAGRVRSRIEAVLDVAVLERRHKGPNPARWKGHMAILLGRQAQTVVHHPALPYEEIQAFLAGLRARSATSARALEFLILSASRTKEVRLATWSEISGDIWTRPPEHMKRGIEHRVPITGRMRAILDEVSPLRRAGGPIFPGPEIIEPMSNGAFDSLLERMKQTAITAHGFRSTFRDWAGDCTAFPREIVEEALSHAVGDATERAYRRRDALEKRRLLMEQWETFCTTPPNANILTFGKPA